MTIQIETTVDSSLSQKEIENGFIETWQKNELPGNFEFDLYRKAEKLTFKINFEAYEVINEIRDAIDGDISKASVRLSLGNYLADKMIKSEFPRTSAPERQELAQELIAGNFKLSNTQEIIDEEIHKRLSERSKKITADHQARISSQTNKHPMRASIQARDTFSFPKGGMIGSEKEAKGIALKNDVDQLKLYIEAMIGRMTLQDEPFIKKAHSSYILNFWAPYGDGDEARHDVIIRPEDRTIEVSVYRASPLMNIKIDIPGEIVGRGLSDEINGSRKYRGLFFSTERGQKDANLFDIVDLVAKAVVMTKNNLAPSQQPDGLNEQDDDHGLRP